MMMCCPYDRILLGAGVGQRTALTGSRYLTEGKGRAIWEAMSAPLEYMSVCGFAECRFRATPNWPGWRARGIVEKWTSMQAGTCLVGEGPGQNWGNDSRESRGLWKRS